MDDDNVIKPNQDFQIPTMSGDDQTNASVQVNQDTNPVQNVNEETNAPEPNVANTQSPTSASDSEPIKINDPYDFVLGNKSNPYTSNANSVPNPLGGNTSVVPPSTDNTNTTASGSVDSTPPSSINTLGGLDYSQNTVVSDNITSNNATLSGSDNDDANKNRAEVNEVLNSALSMDSFKNLNKPLEHQEVPDPYTNVTSNQNTSPLSSATSVDTGIPNQPSTISGNTYQNPDFVTSNTDLPPISTQTSQQQEGFSQKSEGTFINPYATSGANSTTSTNDQSQGVNTQGGQTQEDKSTNSGTIPDRSEDIFGVVSYVIGLNVLMLIYSYLRNDKFLKFHAVQSIGFNLVFIIIFLVFTSLSRGSLSLAFLIANVILFIIWVLLSILLMYKAYQGEKYSFIFFGALANKLS